MSLHNSRRNPIIRNPNILKGLRSNLLKPWPRGSYYLYYFGQQTNLLSALKKDILSASRVGLLCNFEKIVWNKSFPCLCSDVQKCKKPTENCLPTIIITLLFPLSDNVKIPTTLGKDWLYPLWQVAIRICLIIQWQLLSVIIPG